MQVATYIETAVCPLRSGEDRTEHMSKRCLTVKAETGHVAKNRLKSSSKQR